MYLVCVHQVHDLRLPWDTVSMPPPRLIQFDNAARSIFVSVRLYVCTQNPLLILLFSFFFSTYICNMLYTIRAAAARHGSHAPPPLIEFDYVAHSV